MDLSFLDKFFLYEDTSINIVANIVLEKTKKKINLEYLKHINHFNQDKNNYPTDMITYYYLLNVIYNTNCIMLDTKSLLNGKILNNEYNNLLTEDSIILLYLKIKLHCSKNIFKIIPFELDFRNLLIKQIEKYENFLDTKDTELLDKDISSEIKEQLLMVEYKKINILKISADLILSYYFFKFDKKNLDEFEVFINKIEDLTEKYIDKNLNMNLEHFWEYIISYI